MQKKLIDAALKQYALHGYHGATMRKIAKEVGIKPASIYFFYKNKEDLFTVAFKQFLDNHFNKMKSILNEKRDEPVQDIFSAMFEGISDHHRRDMQGTDAYISLVTSPIPKISQYLYDHMQRYNDWLVESLDSILVNSYPEMPAGEINRIIKQFVLIGNGVFWGIKLYDGTDFEEQVILAGQLMHSLLDELHQKYV
ncbi:TetR/AcrR family transcriptional regulator [Oceanobacillus sp. CFH 90083]|uniref:TetR/AcrR family transcriptional regulator n=1 Tax=Oceanobacillus sp. CFH 90083 TaxID=2592336 RepID=UPI00128B4955|nr:TetR/AcrR family transcriptional regulator [Oceanobacillus sp. CFH 90083]